MMKETCAVCYGTGAVKCEVCGGSGEMPFTGLLDQECLKCKGSGRAVCRRCAGSGLTDVRPEPEVEAVLPEDGRG
jgi:DnaJ-class molecular chaperone